MVPGVHKVHTMVKGSFVEAELQILVDLHRLPVLPYRFIDTEKHPKTVPHGLNMSDAVTAEQLPHSPVQTGAEFLLVLPIERICGQLEEGLGRMHYQGLSVITDSLCFAQIYPNRNYKIIIEGGGTHVLISNYQSYI